MVMYEVWFKDLTPYGDKKGRGYGFESLDEAREWARKVCEEHSNPYNKNFKGKYVFVVENTAWRNLAPKDGYTVKGIVYFDNNRAGYKGLGWVYINAKSLAENRTTKVDSAYKLYSNGSVTKFTTPIEIMRAKALTTYNSPIKKVRDRN